MNRRRFIKASAATAFLSPWLADGQRRGSRPPNVILVLVDDMGWTGLSVTMDDRFPEACSDFYQTPRIAALARQGMRFSDAYSPGSMCTPSRAAILTGKTPAQLHMTTPGPRQRAQAWQKLQPPAHTTELPTREATIAELLHTRGYATAHFGKWHLGRANPGRHGFDEHDGSTGNGGDGALKDPNPKDVFGATARASAFISKQTAQAKPFYCQISHYSLHEPIEALSTSVQRFEKLPRGRRHSNPEYAAMTYDLDTAVGRLLDHLDKLGIADQTYVIFMSDNGAGAKRRSRQTNAPLASGKGSLHEGGIRVPLIVCGPNTKAGSTCHTPVTGCDLLPTICELAGVRKVPKAVEGMSLVPLLRGKGVLPGGTTRELVFHTPHYGLGPRQLPQSAIRVGDLKLLVDLESGTARLFDLRHDIGEARDLSARMPEEALALRQRLDARLARIGAQLATPNATYDPAAVRTRRRPGDRSGRAKRGGR